MRSRESQKRTLYWYLTKARANRETRSQKEKQSRNECSSFQLGIWKLSLHHVDRFQYPFHCQLKFPNADPEAGSNVHPVSNPAHQSARVNFDGN